MTIASETDRELYSGNGSTTTFPITFNYQVNADVRVVHRDSAGAQTLWVEGTEYTIVGSDVEAATAPASGEKLLVIRGTALLQSIDYTTAGKFPAETHEQALDKLTMLIQMLKEITDRTLKLKETSSVNGLELPEPEALKFLQWDSDLQKLNNVAALAIGNLAVTSFMETLLDDADAASARVTLGVQNSIQGSAVGNLMREFTLIIKRDTSGADGITCQVDTSPGKKFNISSDISTVKSAVFAKGGNASVGSGDQAVTYSLNADGDVVTVDLAHNVSNILAINIPFRTDSADSLARDDLVSDNIIITFRENTGAGYDLTSMVNGKLIYVSMLYIVGGAE